MNLDDLAAYEKMTWETSSYELENAVEDLVAEVKRLLPMVSAYWDKLMLAEAALGEIRYYQECGDSVDGLGEIIEHYRNKLGVNMPHTGDEDEYLEKMYEEEEE